MSVHITHRVGPSNDEPPEDDRSGMDAAPGSLLGRLRNQAKKQQLERYEDFAVGGEFGDWLMIRYKPLSPDVMDDFINRQGPDISKMRAIAGNMDMMAQACVAIIAHDPMTGEKTVLEDDQGPVKLTGRLIRLLDMPHPGGIELTAREVISMLFGNNGTMIGEHGDRVTTWMRNPGSTVDP